MLFRSNVDFDEWFAILITTILIIVANSNGTITVDVNTTSVVFVVLTSFAEVNFPSIVDSEFGGRHRQEILFVAEYVESVDDWHLRHNIFTVSDALERLRRALFIECLNAQAHHLETKRRSTRGQD